MLQHYGVMAGGNNRLTLEIVSGSATGELQGLTGQMTIAIDGGAHSYRLDYAFG